MTLCPCGKPARVRWCSDRCLNWHRAAKTKPCPECGEPCQARSTRCARCTTGHPAVHANMKRGINQYRDSQRGFAVTPELRAEALRLRAAGLLRREVAVTLGLSYWVVLRIEREAGVPPRKYTSRG